MHQHRHAKTLIQESKSQQRQGRDGVQVCGRVRTQKSMGTGSSAVYACSQAPQAPQPGRWQCPEHQGQQGCT
eukprot:286620-Pelagomonas_calceolata.AAC.3